MSRLAPCLLALTLSTTPLIAQESKPQWQRLLQADDAKKAQQLEQSLQFAQILGRWKDAAKTAEELHKLRESKQGKDHWETVNAVWTLKAMQTVQAASVETQKRYVEGLALRVRAGQLKSRAQFDEAAKLSEQALKVLLDVLGEEHPHTATSYNDLAEMHGFQVKNSEAEQGYRSALTIYRKSLGEEHPHTGQLYNNLVPRQGKE